MNIFIDTEDMEERYGEQLYYDFLIEQSIDLQQRIDKATELLSNWNYDDTEFEVDRKNINKLLSILKGKEMINNEK